MAYTWDKSLETGNTAIDTQHKQLIEALNNLMDACSKGKGRAEIESTLDFLCEYTVHHFSDEEGLQQRYKYPDFANHKKLHDAFKTTAAQLSAEVKRDGPSVALVGKLNTSIGNWLVKHIKAEDKKIAEYIRSQN